jgi:polyhydroxyalkanoate synthesis regulator protein
MDGQSISVLNHETKKDVTREVLISMILEQKYCGNELFTENLIRTIIWFYGNPLQNYLHTYLHQVQATFNSFLFNAND